MKTHIIFILDKSESMASRRDATISGFNEYVQSLREDDALDKVSMSLTVFDTEFRDVFYDVPLEDVPALDANSYVPSGLTALYDAVGHVVNKTAPNVKKKHRALVVIMTDGEENSSQEHSRQQIFDLIKSYEDKGNYTFVFLGCDQDVWAEGGKIGMSKGNVAAYDGNNMQEAYARLSNETRHYRGNLATKASTSFWTEENKDSE